MAWEIKIEAYPDGSLYVILYVDGRDVASDSLSDPRDLVDAIDTMLINAGKRPMTLMRGWE